MINELCNEINNWFEDEKHFDEYKIESGIIAPSVNLAEGQYYRIIGSLFNDGVHKFGENDLVDESFEGSIWTMRVPPEVVRLVQQIETYNSSSTLTPFVSESFGGYSYTKATGANGVPLDWRTIFRSSLNRWRKI